ncbi:uncharacterized protein LOC122664745 [Telopea speciosissima]|uniref:uncharacterized protein LOC122664745 n=1 Tax=Telopea speciosissima TaxID=54955 RepID=UPI001CC42A39|nr:uncharacterized protein LOC122664745 [Telopea speciosissima]XP_043716659.1 uncharacterized protein LOC122664745 [Telopea speciosissima]
MGDSFTIQISSDLVNRLVADGDKVKKKTKKPKHKIPHGHDQSQNKEHQKQTPGISGTQRGAGAAGWPLQPPVFIPVGPPPTVANAEVVAIQSILKESERVVERLQKQEENMVQEVTQRAKELHDKEFKLPYQKPMPCLAEKDACLECYKENAKDPLKCATVVKTFVDCARRERQQVSSALD